MIEGRLSSLSTSSKGSIVYKEKIRCNMCYEIPIIKEIFNGGGLSYFISAECLNKHGVMYSALSDFCSDKNQIDNIKCYKCSSFQGIVDSSSKFFNYCKNCKKFYCPSCNIKHFNKYSNSHNTTSIQGYDFLCKIHGSPYSCFCVKCNDNICKFCQQREHLKHEIINYKEIKPNEQKIQEISLKIEKQRTIVDEVNKILDDFIKITNIKIKDYKEKLSSIIKFNSQVLNCIEEKKINYQSIVNLDKIIDLDINNDIGWIKEIQNNLEKFINTIKSNAVETHNKKEDHNDDKEKIDKEILNTIRESVIGNTSSSPIDSLEFKQVTYDDFSENELLKEIGTKNYKILKNSEIFGDLKNIYIMKECNSYLILADNGIFIYDIESNDLICYLDSNQSIEYEQIDNLSYYYNKPKRKIYLLLGTNTNKIKIYCIDEIKECTYELIQEIKLEKIINLYCNRNGNLIILEENGFSIFFFNGNQFEQEKEHISQEKTTTNLYITENYMIFTVIENENIILYNKDSFEKIFSIEKININDKSKIFELSKDLICVNCQEIIQIINVKQKNLQTTYDKIKMNYIESVDLFNDKEILLSCNCNNKLVFYILGFDISNATIEEKKNIEDLQCKLIRKIDKNKVILYTKYGINIIEN